MGLFGWAKGGGRTGASERPSAPPAIPDWSASTSVVGRFRQISERVPDRLAVADDRRSLTYGALGDLAGAIHAAIDASAAADGPVAILLPNEARYGAAIIGALAAGRGYVPLDVDHPIERNRLIAEHAGCTAVISSGEIAGSLAALFPASIAVIDVDALDGAAASLPVDSDPDGLAWIIYTSGSTGAPKGVFQNQRNFLRDVRQLTVSLDLTSEDRMALMSSPTLVAGARSLMAALLNGASAHVLAPLALGPAGVLREIRARRITAIRFVPALFRAVIEALDPGERIACVRRIYLSGDRVTWKDVDAFRRAFAEDAALILSLGSTEVSTTYLQWRVDASLPLRGLQTPVGRPLVDRPVRLEAEDGGDAAPGETGEFVVSSDYLALGYWRDPELTAARFGVDPDRPGFRTFRTGDLGRVRPDGLFDLVGRKDHQIKLAGRRIEPGEVESALKSRPGVRDAAIVVRRAPSGEPRALIGYCELEAGVAGLLPRHLSAMMGQVLPAHMRPAAITIIERLPRLPNLKVDYQKLAEIDRARGDSAAERDADPVLDRVSAIFEAVLEVQNATPDDNLASLGGDSLQALHVMMELEKEFAIAVPPDLFEAAQSIRELAQWLSRGSGRPAAAL